jgi:AcrR family transcriptional regulator
MVMSGKPRSDSEAREAVLDAADRLFYERGFQSVSMDEVRDAAGVPLKRIYAHFPSKAQLIEAYLVRRDDRWRDGIERFVTRRTDDPREQLLGVFDAVAAWVQHTAPYRGCAFQNAFGELSGTSPFTANIVQEHKHHLRDFLERTARRAHLRRPAELARQLIILVEGSLITAAIDDDPSVPRRAKAAAAVLIDAASVS